MRNQEDQDWEMQGHAINVAGSRDGVGEGGVYGWVRDVWRNTLVLIYTNSRNLSTV